MEPTELQQTGEYEFGTPSTLLNTIKFEDDSDNDSTHLECHSLTEELAASASSSKQPSKDNTSNLEYDDVKSVSTEKPFTFEEDDFVIKKEIDVHAVVIKDELDISPIVLQPRRTPCLQPIAEERPSDPRPGTSSGIDATSAPLCMITVQSAPRIKLEDHLYEDNGKHFVASYSGLVLDVNTTHNIDKTERQHRYDQCEYSASRINSLQTYLCVNLEEKTCYKCMLCEYSASRLYNLRRHTRTSHFYEKAYKCTRCDYSASRLSSLQMHVYRHMTKKPYRCEHCDYSAANQSTLRRHIRRHTGEKPYKCEHCEYSASQVQNLRRHTRSHRDERPYKCSRCEYSTFEINTLQRHIRIHTDEII